MKYVEAKAVETALTPKSQLPKGNFGYKTVSKNKLSDFAKDVIRDCATQPRNSVYKTYKQVLMFCPKSGYTIEQVGKYLRYVKRAVTKNQYFERKERKINKKKETVSPYVSKEREDKCRKRVKNVTRTPSPPSFLAETTVSFSGGSSK